MRIGDHREGNLSRRLRHLIEGEVTRCSESRSYTPPVSFQIAQVNIARLRAPLDSPELSGFVAALDPVNASADEAPGFIWRLQTEEGNATSVQAFEWDVKDSAGIIVNMSVWASIEQLAAWVYGPLHRAVLRQRRSWFERAEEMTTALWWVPHGHRPTTLEAEERLIHLRLHGPTERAFTFRVMFGPGTGSTSTVARCRDEEWFCPA